MKHLLFLPIILFSLGIAAQDHPIQHAKYEQDVFQRFDNFTMKNGLPCNTIRKIFQDRDGFIWLATDNGLSRYDGSRFVNFLPVEGDSLSLSNREVTSIAQTRDGYIWVGTKDGLNKLDPTTGVFRQYRVGNAPFMHNNYIRALLVSSDGQLWFDCANGTLTNLNPINHKFRHFYSFGNVYADYFQHTLFETYDRKIWAGGVGFHLRQYDMATNQFNTIIDTTCKVHGRECIADLWQDAQKNIWVANAASPSLLYSPKTKRFVGIPKLTGIYAIQGDNFGNIWFGGYYSTLFKYNPKKNTVTCYEHSDINPQSKLGGQVYSLFCDRSGVVWIGSEKGLSRLSPYKGKFPLYRHIPEAPSPKSSSISAVFQDSDGDVWFGTDNSAAFYYSPTSNIYRNFTHERNNPNTIGSNHVTAIAQDKQGTLWFTLWGGVGGAINSLNKKSGVAKRYNTSDDYYWYSDIEIKNDKIIVGSWGTAVGYFDTRKKDYVKIISPSSMGFIRDLGGIHSLAADGSGDIWFYSYISPCVYGTTTKNFSCYFPKNSSMLSNYNQLRKNGFRGTITNLDLGSGLIIFMRDGKGTAWVASSTSLSELNKKENHFNSYKIKGEVTSPATSNSFNGSGFWLGGANRIVHFSIDSKSAVEFKTNISIGNVSTTAEVKENRLVVSSSTGVYVGVVNVKSSNINFLQISNISFNASCRLANGKLLLGGSMGLYILDNGCSQLKKVTGEGSNTLIHSMHSLNGREIYVGTANGLLLYQQNRGIVRWWKPNPRIKNQLIDDIVCSVTQTPDGNVWLGTDKGYSRLNPDNKTFTNYFNSLHDALTSPLVSTVFTDSKGFTWAGTTSGDGLNRINNQTGYIDNYRHLLWDSTSIRKGDITDVFEASDGIIWVGTENGLCKFMPKTNNFTSYNMHTGLGSNTILAIQEDSQGNLWMSTQAGISRFNSKTLQCTNYTWKDGLQGGVFSRKCATKLEDGRLVFGGSEGYNMFYPDSIRMNPHSPLPIITSVSVNGKVRYISSPKKLNLSYNERNIEISFSSSDYNFPENNQLAYKLDGFDQEFKRAATGQPAVYTNLLPGSYRFILQATNNDGKWGKSTLVLNIKIGYPIWLQWWAVLLEVSAILGLVYLLMKFHVMNITRQKQLLEKEVTLRTEQLQQKNEEIATHHNVLENQKEHTQKLYNQLSDSIEYAEFIQQANSLTTIQRDSILGRNFLLSLPKEKLSGDLFWAQRHNNKAIFVVADCMLHGVPGAFLSMVGISLIKEISLSSAYSSPDETLNALHQRVKEFSTVYDQYKHLLNNIEIGYCVLDRSRMKIAFSGKQINLYISRNVNSVREIIVCHGNQQWVQDSSHNVELCLAEYEVFPGDYLYMFSDGLTKQMNLSNNEDSNKLQLKQLLEYSAEYPFEMQEALILEKINSRKVAGDQKDDITFIGVNV